MPKFLDAPKWYEPASNYFDGFKVQNGTLKRNFFSNIPDTLSVSETVNTSFSLPASAVAEGGEFEGITTGDIMLDYANQVLYRVTAVTYLSGGSSPTYYVSLQVIQRHLYAVKFRVFTYSSYVYTYLWSNKTYSQTTMTNEDLCSLLSYQGTEFPATGYSGTPYVSSALIYAIKPTNVNSGNILSFLIDSEENTHSNRFYSISYSLGLVSVESVKQIL